jgi:hypothetical protein
VAYQLAEEALSLIDSLARVADPSEEVPTALSQVMGYIH